MDLNERLRGLGIDPSRHHPMPPGTAAENARQINQLSGRRANPATPGQTYTIESLIESGDRDFNQLPLGLQRDLAGYERLSSYDASMLISAMLTVPYRNSSRGSRKPMVGVGFYLREGQVVRIKASGQGKGNCYASTLDPDTGRFEYVRGLIYRLTPEMRISPDQAQELGRKWGRCLVCGAHLTDPRSIERGVGPYCAQRL